MEKWIYKITNSINNKVYIGQSNNPIRRYKEHITEAAKTDTVGLYAAMRKYGINNFKIEIIEGPVNNYNEREIYWIKQYDSFNNGYNLTMGGENPPILTGENSSLTTFSDEIILEIQKDLIFSTLSYDEISNKYSISIGYLTRINKGICRKNGKFNYPLRNQSNYKKTDELNNIIIDQLINTSKSTEDIARENNIDSLTVYYINKGTRHRKDDIEYPIRLDQERISQITFEKIVNDLLDNKLKLSSIQDKYNLSKSTINRINSGKNYFRDYLSYPIRPSNKRVYKENL